MESNIDAVLVERGKRYGEWYDHARITWMLKTDMRGGPTYVHMQAWQQEALDMIAHKIGRIVCGDPNYIDSWQDIAGYAQLVVNELQKRVAE